MTTLESDLQASIAYYQVLARVRQQAAEYIIQRAIELGSTDERAAEQAVGRMNQLADYRMSQQQIDEAIAEKTVLAGHIRSGAIRATARIAS